MSWFDSWVSTAADLEPGKRYRVTYHLTCPNLTDPQAISGLLADRKILMNITAGIIAGIDGATDEMAVQERMSQQRFRDLFAAAIDEADKTAWVSCLNVRVVSIEVLVPADSGPLSSGKGGGLFDFSSGIATGLVLVVVLIGGVIYIGGRRS